MKVLDNITGFDKDGLTGKFMIIGNQTDQEKQNQALDRVRIACYFKSREKRDEALRLGRKTENGKIAKYLRPGRTPQANLKAKEYWTVSQECKAKNERLTGEERERLIHVPVYDPDSKTVVARRMSKEEEAKRREEEKKRRLARNNYYREHQSKT